MSRLTTGISGGVEGWIADVAPLLSVPVGVGSRPTVRVGIDLTSVTEVAASVARFGDRYIERMFTPHERACCRHQDRPETPDTYRVESLAARFAAKEAALKVLRPPGSRPPWRDIEVYRTEGGWCEMRLWGSAAALAAGAGINQWSVSLTHHDSMAAAVVVGIGPAEPADPADGAREARGPATTPGAHPGTRSGGITRGMRVQ